MKEQSKPVLLFPLLFPNAILFLLIPSSSCAGSEGGHGLLPLVLVPGLAGNQLDARLTDAYSTPNSHCRVHGKDAGWFRLWMNSSTIQLPLVDCFTERMTLFYDPVIDDYRNAPGVETRAPYFGFTEGFQYQDPDDRNTEYMASLVRKLEQMGYREGQNLFGAPYDFRYGLSGNGRPSRVGTEFLQNLRDLVEKASNSNGGKPAIILTHSYGGLLTLQLLNRNPPAWRRNFVKHFIALAAPWGGAAIDMSFFASGNYLSNPGVNPLRFRRELRSWESNLWLLPSPKFFGRDPIIVTPRRNYSAFDMREFLIDIGAEAKVGQYEARILPLIERLDPPGVPVTCIMGTGITTAEMFVHGEGGFDEQPKVVFGDGDGTVNLKSLLGLENEWADEAQQQLKVIKLPNVTHGSVLSESGGLREVVREVLDVNFQSMRPIAWQ